jgi:hypothetical protein
LPTGLCQLGSEPKPLLLVGCQILVLESNKAIGKKTAKAVLLLAYSLNLSGFKNLKGLDIPIIKQWVCQFF